ncbi:hypothetical protein [Paraburkholderia fungorum]|nr:hypothetical protein [Paraburkholderia fungorum]
MFAPSAIQAAAILPPGSLTKITIKIEKNGEINGEASGEINRETNGKIKA